jgi:hypothetical protein
MFVDFKSAIEGSTADAALSITLDAPLYISSDDFLVATISTNRGQAAGITAPAGWVEIFQSADTNDTGNNNRLAVFYKIAVTADESATDYTFSWTNTSTGACGGIVLYANVNLTDPIAAVGYQTGGVDLFPIAPSIYTNQPNTLVLRVFGSDAASGGRVPVAEESVYPIYHTGRFALNADNISSNIDSAAALADAPQIDVDNTEEATFHLAQGDTWIAGTIALNAIDNTTWYGFIDHFDDGSLDTSLWTAVSTGNATVEITDSTLHIAASTTTAGFIYYNNVIDKTESQLFLMAMKQVDATDSHELSFGLWNPSSGPPTADTTSNLSGERRTGTSIINLTGGNIRYRYWDDGGTSSYWNNSTWTTTISNVNDRRLDDYLIIGLEIDGTNERFRWMHCQQDIGAITDPGGPRMLGLSDWVNFSTWTIDTDNLYLCLGQRYTNWPTSVDWNFEWVRRENSTKRHAFTNADSGGGGTYTLRHQYSY